MGNNNGRVRIIDPNDFDYKYNGDVFGLNNLNMSVPNEDLCIVVELKTNSKSRTILNTKDSVNSIIEVEGQTIRFIDGTSGKTTGYQNYLTTQYTELGTELNELDESLGITNIDIDFNSSYAPLININFIDVKGGALFQSGGQSKYNVLFRFPYPLFELKVKGFYGKPVTYCLHMVKCNIKFNSQTGNFEIAAQFVGYTYAMLSDILIGYLKAAVTLNSGKKLLENKKMADGQDMISINRFIEIMGNIDGLIKGQLKEDNQNTNNLAIIKELKSMIEQTQLGLKDTLSQLQTSIIPPSDMYPYITIIKNPSDGDKVNFLDTKNYREIIPTFEKKYLEFVKSFNEKSGDNEELKLKYQASDIDTLVNVQEMSNDVNGFRDHVKERYNYIIDVNNPTALKVVIDRLKGAAKDVPVTDSLIKFYDFTEIGDELDNMLKTLEKKYDDVSKLVAEDLRAALKSELGFDPTIRNTIMLLTSHVEVFLDLLFEVSSKYKDPARVEEFKKFANQSKSTNIDVNSKTIKDGVIYPWPEYIENGVEKYLGSKKGPLKNPLNVPEIKFVEELYQAMITNIEQEKNQTAEGPIAWNSFAPIDSIFYNDRGIKTPYDRLDATARPDDIVRLMMLRMVGFIGFANSTLSQEEIQAFAESEANLVLKKFDSQPTVLQAIKNYTLDKFTNIDGVINGETNKVLTLYNGLYEYGYVSDIIPIGSTNVYRYNLPVDKGFNNAYYTLSNDNSAKYLLSSYVCQTPLNDTRVPYIEFVTATTYDNKAVSSPSLNSPSVFLLSGLKAKNYTPENIKSAGFLANNGRYGVQEYKLINYENQYGVSNQMNFYTLFFNSTDKTNAGLSEKRIGKTNFDLKLTFPVIESMKKLNEAKDVMFGFHKDIGNTILNLSKNSSELCYPFFNFGVNDKRLNTLSYSLFTSRFYNAQTNEGRAFLFLHSLPWRGLIDVSGEDNVGIFRQPEILNVFKYRTGFIQVPELFPAFIGGLLWRYESATDPLVFNDDLLPLSGHYPKKDEYLKTYARETKKDNTFGMCFYAANLYQKIEDEILKLPDVVKKQFKNEFDNFVNNASYTNSYKNIAKLFEIVPTSGPSDTNWVTNYLAVNTAAVNATNNVISTQTLANNFTLSDGDTFDKRYAFFNFIYSDDPTENEYGYNFYSEFKDDSAASNKLKELMFSYKYIANNSWYMWSRADVDLDCSAKPKIKESTVNLYVNKFLSVIGPAVEEKEKVFFSNNDNEQVKLEIYRTLKKIYDKWIADTSKGEAAATASKDILFQCCKIKDTTGQRLTTDDKLREKRGSTELGLIDSFRFLTRAYQDIGDIFQINPVTVSKILLESSNNSFYDVVGRILNDNKFEFIALPNFVDYNNIDELKNVFKPYPYYELTEATTGPSFVCMYVGQTSTKLDFGPNAEYPDDGFNFTDETSIPDDFTTSGQTYEDKSAAFIVKYGQQNQNLFKDVILDQAEFNETAESLNVTDAIANHFSQANQTYVGQNLYNIYSIRSYKVEVEMMGDAMIQPMMYFQLDNIPMFRGAYLITRVRHNIKPNYMSTHFTGTRINRNQTPLIDVSTLFSSMLEGYKLPAAKPNSGIKNISGGKFAPIIVTIQENAGSNGNIEQGKITRSPIQVPKEISVTINSDDNRKILTEAVSPLKAMLTEWVAWMKSQGFKGNNGKYANIISAYRTIADQERVRAEAIAAGKPKNSTAEPGTSRHGWGIAIDLQYFDKNGNIISNYVGGRINDEVGFDVTKNPAIKWLYDNAYRFGFIIPPEMRDSVGIEEFWHWEYHGTSAKCILEKNKNIRGYNVTVDKNYDASVTNPKKPDGTVAVYTNCDFISVKQADGTPTTYNGYKQQNFSPTDTIKNVYIPAQNAALPTVSKGSKLLMQAQTQTEGFYVGSKAYRTNNPGNVGTYGGVKVTSFPTLQDGVKAQWDRVLGLAVTNKSKVYKSTDSLFEYISKYAPASDNNDPTAYTNNVINYFKSQNIDITADTTLEQINKIV